MPLDRRVVLSAGLGAGLAAAANAGPRQRAGELQGATPAADLELVAGSENDQTAALQVAIDAAANAMPVTSESALPATSNAAPAFMMTMSRAAPRCPERTVAMISAFSAADPPRIAADATLGRPTSAGCR